LEPVTDSELLAKCAPFCTVTDNFERIATNNQAKHSKMTEVPQPVSQAATDMQTLLIMRQRLQCTYAHAQNLNSHRH